MSKDYEKKIVQHIYAIIEPGVDVVYVGNTEFEIIKEDLTIELVAPSSLVYDGTAKTYSVKPNAISDEVKLTYYELKRMNGNEVGPDLERPLSSAPTEINTHGYRVVAEFAGNSEYEAMTVYEDFKITAIVYNAELTVPAGCKYSEEEGYTCVYDGLSKAFGINAIIGGENVNDIVSPSIMYKYPTVPWWGTEAPVQVGTYQIIVGNSNENYIPTIDKAIKLTIVAPEQTN